MQSVHCRVCILDRTLDRRAFVLLSEQSHIRLDIPRRAVSLAHSCGGQHPDPPTSYNATVVADQAGKAVLTLGRAAGQTSHMMLNGMALVSGEGHRQQVDFGDPDQVFLIGAL